MLTPHLVSPLHAMPCQAQHPHPTPPQNPPKSFLPILPPPQTQPNPNPSTRGGPPPHPAIRITPTPTPNHEPHIPQFNASPFHIPLL
ncbi:unnamed protein product [Periconia digitata]|uniref:Uncharacterized protein n=1 Tax=Periconia digitata TaxID=1303443 RepID=A0A9W4U3U1_9PLEO|nr:unnamed protein product [Periconia digitata]